MKERIAKTRRPKRTGSTVREENAGEKRDSFITARARPELRGDERWPRSWIEERTVYREEPTTASDY